MSKSASSSGRTRPMSSTVLGRVDPGAEEDRPFAEIRRAFHDALRILFLHRWAFFIPFCTVTCVAFILSLYYPRQYRAQTTFERRNDPVMTNLPLAGGAATFKHFRNTIQRDLTSTECLEEVVDRLGWMRDATRDESGALTPTSARKRTSLAQALFPLLSVTVTSPTEELDIVTITYTGPDPTIGVRLVDEIKHTYVRRTMAWIHDYLISQRDYFQRELDLAATELGQAQRRETALRLENPLVDPGNPAALSMELTQREMERRELQLRQREYQAELASLEQLLIGLSPVALDGPPAPALGQTGHAGAINPQVVRLKSEMARIDAEMATLQDSRGMTDLHPEIQKLLDRRRIVAASLETAKDHPGESVAAVPAPLLALPAATDPAFGPEPETAEQARIASQIAAVRSKAKDVEISLEANQLALDRYTQAKRAVYDKQEEFNEVLNAVGQARQRYQQVQTTLANIAPAITAVEQDRLLQFSADQPARGSSIPVSPSAGTVVLMALLAGAAAGIVFVVLAEILDGVFRSSAQVAKSLGLPMLESIDEIVTGRDRRAQFFRRAVLSPLAIVCFLGLAGLTGSMAYLSIQQPWTYQRIRGLPKAAINLFAERSVETPAATSIR